MAEVPLTLLFARGRSPITVECVVNLNGKAPAWDFWENDLGRLRIKGKPVVTAKTKFTTLFQNMADDGSVSPKRFPKEMGKFSAFKLEVRNIQIRFPCFRDGDKWLVTHGFVKPGATKGLGDWPKEQVERAEALMAEYWLRKAQLHARKK